MPYSCGHTPIVTRVTLDGGSTGEYVIALCKECNSKNNFKFLIRKEVIDSEKFNDQHSLSQQNNGETYE